MTVARVSGDRGRCDILFSRIVRSRGRCERCLVGHPVFLGGEVTHPGFDTAHILGRRYSATRCVEDNAWCLCRRCHNLTGQHAGLFMQLVEKTIKEERYWELYRQAQAGIKATGKTALMFWRGELQRLLIRYDELGIAEDWPKVPASWRKG